MPSRPPCAVGGAPEATRMAYPHPAAAHSDPSSAHRTKANPARRPGSTLSISILNQRPQSVMPHSRGRPPDRFATQPEATKRNAASRGRPPDRFATQPEATKRNAAFTRQTARPVPCSTTSRRAKTLNYRANGYGCTRFQCSTTSRRAKTYMSRELSQIKAKFQCSTTSRRAKTSEGGEQGGSHTSVSVLNHEPKSENRGLPQRAIHPAGVSVLNHEPKSENRWHLHQADVRPAVSVLNHEPKSENPGVCTREPVCGGFQCSTTSRRAKTSRTG